MYMYNSTLYCITYDIRFKINIQRGDISLLSS